MKSTILTGILVSVLGLSCGKSLKIDNMTPPQKNAGYDHEGKQVSKINTFQQKDFSSFMQDSARVDEAVSLAWNSLHTGSAIKSDDAKTVNLANVLRASNSKCNFSTADSGQVVNVTGQACPVQVNYSISTNNQGGSETIGMSLVSEVLDANLKVTNNVTSRTTNGSGVTTLTNNGNELIRDFKYQGNGEMTSGTRGHVTSIQTINAQSHSIMGRVTSSQIEEDNEFQFSNYKVLLQQMTKTGQGGQPQSSYYLNGEGITAASYQQMIRGLGFQTQVKKKF